MEETIVDKRFGDIDADAAGFKKSKVCIIQAPYEGTLTYGKGASRAPQAIIDASRHMELFDDELYAETYKVGIYTSPPLDIASESSPEKAINAVKSAVMGVLEAGKFPVLLGGEHSVTVGAVKAAKEFFNDISVLHLDAHHDLRDEYEGSKYNHACVARRIQKICPVVEVGVRNISKEEKDFIDSAQSAVKVISVYDILESHNWKKDASNLLSDTVYITIDLDVLDPSIMPSVGTPEPGGLGWYEFMDFLKIISKDKKIAGFDVVELSPIEGYRAPDFLAAKIVYRLLGYIFFGKK
ncbi:MAG: agmatinase [Candidatus Omnitrophica bacterium]|nr:agmatinase [Candidatus Omnitrophota bacterium]